jgi:hypothetical protein
VPRGGDLAAAVVLGNAQGCREKMYSYKLFCAATSCKIDLPNTVQAIAHTLAIQKRFGGARYRRQQKLLHIQALKRVLLAIKCRVRSISISRTEITIPLSSPFMDKKNPKTQF